MEYESVPVPEELIKIDSWANPLESDRLPPEMQGKLVEEEVIE